MQIRVLTDVITNTIKRSSPGDVSSCVGEDGSLHDGSSDSISNVYFCSSSDSVMYFFKH